MDTTPATPNDQTNTNESIKDNNASQSSETALTNKPGLSLVDFLNQLEDYTPAVCLSLLILVYLSKYNCNSLLI